MTMTLSNVGAGSTGRGRLHNGGFHSYVPPIPVLKFYAPALSQTELFQSFKVKSCCLDSLSGKDNDNASKQCATILRTVEFEGGSSFNSVEDSLSASLWQAIDQKRHEEGQR